MRAVKDWLGNRYPVHRFQESKSTTTWWRYFGFVAETEGLHEEDDEDAGPVVATSGGRHSVGCTLLVHDDGAFCSGPRDKVHNLLGVARYAAPLPSYP